MRIKREEWSVKSGVIEKNIPILRMKCDDENKRYCEANGNVPLYNKYFLFALIFAFFRVVNAVGFVFFFCLLFNFTIHTILKH